MSNSVEKNINNINLPNMISISRIFMAIMFAICFIGNISYEILTIILVASCLSDVLDGLIARKFEMITDFGKMLDPFADKIFAIVLIICFATTNKNLIFPTACIFLIEFSLLYFGYVIKNRFRKIIQSNLVGKLTTVIFYICVFCLLMLKVDVLLIYNVILLTTIIKFSNYINIYLKKD